MSIIKKAYHDFTREEIKYLAKKRIIKKNLDHVQGFPRYFAKIDILKSKEYFGQYGKILKVFISHKVNHNHKKVFSIYITYSNEIEAACVVLCVDSLLIKGKIIRAFFGTTKYCSYFLNNIKCQNLDKCMFLHQLVDEQDIIIEDNMIFTYDDHINLAKKLIHYSSPKIKQKILNMKKPKNIILPFFDFIYLSEEEKTRYFTSGNVNYALSDSNTPKDNFINNSNDSKTESKYINSNINNCEVSIININLYNSSNLYQTCFKNNNNVYNLKNADMSSNSFEPDEFHKSIEDSIKHIFEAKPFFNNLKNYPFKKLEFEFFRKNLEDNGKDFYELFDGCIDCLKDII